MIENANKMDNEPMDSTYGDKLARMDEELSTHEGKMREVDSRLYDLDSNAQSERKTRIVEMNKLKAELKDIKDEMESNRKTMAELSMNMKEMIKREEERAKAEPHKGKNGIVTFASRRDREIRLHRQGRRPGPHLHRGRRRSCLVPHLQEEVASVLYHH